jgi:hypothetical protein
MFTRISRNDWRSRVFIFLMSTLLVSICGAQSNNPLAPANLSTPNVVDTSIGILTFKDGVPDPVTVGTINAQLDHHYGIEAYLNGLPAVSLWALREGYQKAGINDGDVLIFSKLMDCKSLFLTANADTVYFWPILDLSNGPLVFEVPSDVLAVADDFWWRWITDLGVPGPDRGQGGKYLFVGPGYKGPLPKEGYFIRHSATNHVSVLARAFLENDDPEPAVKRIKEQLKIYPYKPGGYGDSIAGFLSGKNPLGTLLEASSPRFVEGTGLEINTIPPNDFSFYEMLDAAVQSEPAEALDPEIAGSFAAIGITHGSKFAPDAQLKSILQDAVAIGNAMARSASIAPRAKEGFAYYDEKSAWSSPLFAGGYDFMNPPPLVTKEGVQPFPTTGARKLIARSSFFYLATGITPAMCMRLPNIGSQYIGTFYDSNGERFDGAKTYKVVLPKNIPAGKFWSLTLYDCQTRSMLQTPQRYPRAGSQSYPSPAAVAENDGSTEIYFSPAKPEGIAAGNWIQTDPYKGWFVLFRLYNPLPAFFDKSWRPSEIEEVID